jgi:hypothetical protein
MCLLPSHQAESVDVVVSELETLGQADLAARVALLSEPNEVTVPPISPAEITLVQTAGGSTFAPLPLAGDLERVMVGSAVHIVRSDFPHLTSAGALSGHIEEHLRRWARDH